MKRIASVFVVLASLCTSARVWSAPLPEAVHDTIDSYSRNLGLRGIEVNLNVRIPILKEDNPFAAADSDLWGTVFLPEAAKSERVPTIFMAAAYRRDICFPLMVRLLAHGYALVIVDNRGTGSSDGVWPGFDFLEQYDAKVIVDKWIPSQPWSDGKVGMFGPSYMGMVQMHVAGLVDRDPVTDEPLHLKAIFPLLAGSDVYKEIGFNGGNPGLEFISVWLSFTEFFALVPPLLLFGEERLFQVDDIKESISIMASHVSHSYQYFYEGFFDSKKIFDINRYYQKSPMIHWPQKPPGGWPFGGVEGRIPSKLPAALTGGWFDVFMPGTLNNFQYGLRAQAPGDKVLIMGEWHHLSGAFAYGLPSIQSMAFPARWFDAKIKRNGDCFLQDFPVVLRVMGEDKWRAEISWPLPESRIEPASLYLSKRHAQAIPWDWYTHTQRHHMFSLSWTKGANQEPGDDPVLRHSPLPWDVRGISSRSNNRWSAGALSMPGDTAKAFLGVDDDAWFYEDERLDEVGVPTFTTEALDHDVEIVGPLQLTFWARTEFDRPVTRSLVDASYGFVNQFYDTKSNALLDMLNQRDVQWVVEVNDVFPAGRSRNVTSGWLRASARPFDPHESERTTEHRTDPSYVPFDPFYNLAHVTKPIREHELYQYAIELWPTTNVWKKGHRIRISISGSDVPHLLPILIPSQNTIVIDSDHEARLDFNVANRRDEGVTWKWIPNIDDYLLHSREECKPPSAAN